MFKKLQNLHISIDETTESQIKNFAEFFAVYNEKVNLISSNDVKFLFEKHIYDSLAINLFIEKYNIPETVRLMDIGTGGGFPSIPLSLIYKNMKITAVDSINKKISFVKTVTEKFNLTNLETKCTRVEELPDDCRNNYDIVVSRAMAELRLILEYAIPFVKTGGFFVAYKSVKAEEEILQAKNALKLLNSTLIDKIEYKLPISEDNRRVLLVVKKEKETPLIYPRQNGLIKKKPL